MEIDLSTSSSDSRRRAIVERYFANNDWDQLVQAVLYELRLWNLLMLIFALKIRI